MSWINDHEVGVHDKFLLRETSKSSDEVYDEIWAKRHPFAPLWFFIAPIPIIVGIGCGFYLANVFPVIFGLMVTRFLFVIFPFENIWPKSHETPSLLW